MRKAGAIFITAAVLLAALTLYSRGPAPWRNGLTSDEMHHLESWRNRYRTDDIAPVFMAKVESYGLLSAPWSERLRTAYDSSSFVQRAILVVADVHPPLYGVVAEVIEATTRSSLVAARIPALLASIAAVFFMFRLGRDMRDPTLGLWLGTLMAIGSLAQVYAGIARPYAYAQLGIALVLSAYVREMRAADRSPWRFLLAALFAQLTHWMAWAIVGPLVALVLIRRRRDGAGIGTLAARTWWYGLLTLVLVAEAVLHLNNPGIAARPPTRSLLIVWYQFSLSSPFAALDPLLGIGTADPWEAAEPETIFSPSAGLFLFLIAVGIGVLAFDRRWLLADGERRGAAWIRAAILVTAIMGLAVPVMTGTSMRFMMIFMVVPAVAAGVGAHWLLRAERASRLVVLAGLALFSVIAVMRPEEPFRRIFYREADYAAVAERLRGELEPDAIWTAYHYSLGNCLYRYGPLPEPVLLLDETALAAFLATLPRPEGPTYVFANYETVQRANVLRRARTQWEFDGKLVLVEVPAATGTLRGGGFDR